MARIIPFPARTGRPVPTQGQQRIRQLLAEALAQPAPQRARPGQKSPIRTV